MTTTTKERPIIMSGESIRAILEGRKTQTRRVCKPQPEVTASEIGPLLTVQKRRGTDRWIIPNAIDEWAAECPYGVPGDRLWVRETFSTRRYGMVSDLWIRYEADGTVEYRMVKGADKKYRTQDTVKRRSIYMPRWAARLLLEVTEVRVERVQEITEDGAIAEGVQAMPSAPASLTDRTAFGKLWNALNAKRGHGWEDDPWVWAISFRKLDP